MEEIKNNYKICLKSLAISVFITLLLLFVLSLILALTSVKENMMSFGIIFISTISILLGSFFASKKIKEKGIIYGAVIGLCYMLILYLASSLINSNFELTVKAVSMFLFGILGGAVGGILGVNLK